MGPQLGWFASGGGGWLVRAEEASGRGGRKQKEEQKLVRQQGEGVEEKANESSKEQTIAKGLGWELPGLSGLMDIITLTRKLKQALETKPKQGEVIKDQLAN